MGLPGRVEGTRKRTRESIRLYRQKLGSRIFTGRIHGVPCFRHAPVPRRCHHRSQRRRLCQGNRPQTLGRRKCLPYRTPRRTQDQCLGTRRRGRVHSCSQIRKKKHKRKEKKKKTKKKKKKKKNSFGTMIHIQQWHPQLSS